jgi:hypothetical protein
MTLLLLFGGGGSVTQTVTLQAQAGLTSHSIRLRSRSTGIEVAVEVATELAAGVYSADFTSVPAGTYFAQFVRDSDSAIIRFSDATLTLTTATFPVSGAGGAVELDSATLTKINRIEAVATGTVTGAGTSTEVFVGPSATLTITVDSSGNRSAVVVT